MISVFLAERHVKTACVVRCSNSVASAAQELLIPQKYEVRRMGIGALVVRGAALAATGGLLYATVLNPVMNWVRNDNMVVEQGYVSPKLLSIQGKKNGTGNIETYLQYKSGDETVSLPVMKGPQGPLVGTVDYWWQSIVASQREELAVDEWPAISNDAKHGIMSKELQVIMDTFYGVNGTGGSGRGLQQPQYSQPKQQK